jgi:hypothetical protein
MRIKPEADSVQELKITTYIHVQTHSCSCHHIKFTCEVLIIANDRTVMGVGLVIGFIGHFNTQLVTTLHRSLSHTD